MKNKIHKIMVCLAMIIIIFANSNILLAKEIEFPIAKEATNLDDGFDTKVTLSINPDAEGEKIVDIVYVVDVSMITSNLGTDLLSEAYSLVTEFNAQENLKANVALVIFSNGAKQVMGLTACSSITSSSYMRNQIYSFSNLMWIAQNATGSNLQSALIMAKGILDNSTTGSEPEDRHVIFVTDGGNYTYNNADGVTATTVYRDSSGTYRSIGNGDSSGDYGSSSRDTKISMYYNETGDYGKAFEKLMQEKNSIKERALTGYKWKDTNAARIEALEAEGKLTVYDSVDQITNLETYPYTNLEVGTVSAAMALEDIKDAGYKIHTIGYLYSYGFDGGGNITNRLFGLPTIGFLKWTKNVGDLYLQESTTMRTDDLNKAFEDINEGLIQNIESGSYIIDEMGYGEYSDGSSYNMDFVNDIEKISITFDGEELDKELIENNKYGFGKDDTLDKEYKFILTYYPNGIEGDSNNECFKLDINFDIDVGIPVKVEYHETLNESSRKTKNGEYGKYDKDGSKKYSSIKANKSATLNFVNEDYATFSVPTLSYIVDNPIEEDTKEEEKKDDSSSGEKNETKEDENKAEESSTDKKEGVVKTGDIILIHLINITIALFVITLIRRRKKNHNGLISKH